MGFLLRNAMKKHAAMTRLLSLDVFRGVTIALMILVNSPGHQFSYPWLQHSAWNGCTLADVVFPFFIVIVGISSVLALTNLKTKGFSNQQLFKIIYKRSIYLFFMGLLLNFLLKNFDLAHLRILGVLQRIALCYFFSSLLFITTKIKYQVIIITVLLIGYWFLMTQFTPISSISVNSNLVGYFDQFIFSSRHLYTPMFDPEGLLSTLPAIASALFGNVMGAVLISSRTKPQQLRWMVGVGLILSAVGLLWNATFPINKSLWSSSYVLWTSGLSFLVFAMCFELIEIKCLVKWSKPFVLLGKNAMLFYMLHIILLKIQATIVVFDANWGLVNLRFYITDWLFGSFSPKNASLGYAAAYTLFCLFLLKCIKKQRL